MTVKRLNVVITQKDHPHRGCRGHIVVNPDGTVTVAALPMAPGLPWVRVELDECSHQNDSACFVVNRPGAFGKWETP